MQRTNNQNFICNCTVYKVNIGLYYVNVRIEIVDLYLGKISRLT